MKAFMKLAYKVLPQQTASVMRSCLFFGSIDHISQPFAEALTFACALRTSNRACKSCCISPLFWCEVFRNATQTYLLLQSHHLKPLKITQISPLLPLLPPLSPGAFRPFLLNLKTLPCLSNCASTRCSG